MLAFAATLAAAGLCAVACQVERATRPDRRLPTLGPAEVRIDVEKVAFQSTDGVRLHAWLFPAFAGSAAPVLLVHDVGSSKASVLSLALRLQDEGFEVLALDLRAHGESEGRRSTYGLHEKRDVVGAFDFLSARRGQSQSRVGAYGAGAGAHAVVLAATERPGIRVLVLDGLYPDAAYPLARAVFRDWDWGVAHLRGVPGGMLAALSGMHGEGARASGVMARLVGRDMLLLAPQNDVGLAGEIRAMLEDVPEQADSDGNMVMVPASQAQGLYGDDLRLHHERVVSFFVDRLRPGKTPT